MRHYFSAKVRVILVVAVLMAALLAVVNSLTGINVGEVMVQSILTPLRTGVSELKDQAEQIYSYMFNYEALQAENVALKEKIAQMEDNARVADSVSRENDRLRALLNLLNAHEDYKLVDAYIIAWGSNDWTNTLTINRGANLGIKEGMCAITANGEVVGLVMVGEIYPTTHMLLISRGIFNKALDFSDLHGEVLALALTVPIISAFGIMLLKKQDS